MKTLEWFVLMIGRKIYRQSDGCECSTCKEIVKNGLIVRDIEHAKYLHMVQNELGIEYRATKNATN